MACCKSLLARRIVLWYILIGSIVILPLTCTVSLGCKFMNVGFDQNNFQGLGIFKTSVYAESQFGSNDLGKFLGCVNYSQFWEEETNDVGFLIARIASGFLLGFATLATIISMGLQCFCKHGKSRLWNLMRICYIIALFSQGVMYTIFYSDICKDLDGTQECWPGQNGFGGVVNFVLLLGMVVTTFVSFPPRNPVFQCWGNHENCDDSDEISTEEEDENMKASKSLSVGDAVSLFGGSRMSRKSNKSSSKKSVSQQQSVESKMTEEEISQAEKGLLKVNTKEAASSSKSHDAAQRSMSIPGVEKYLATPSIANKSVCSGSIVSCSSVKCDTSEKFKKAGSTVEPYLVTEESSIAESGSEGTSNISRSSKSNASRRSKKSVPGAKYLAKLLPGAKGHSDNVSSSSAKSNRSSNSYRSSQSKTTVGNSTGSILPLSDDETAEILNFMEQLVEMTEVTEGGRRVKTDELDRKIELVDEYPKKANGEIESNPNSDLVKIRTEYYDLGSRTVKEITHSDGSRTVVTTIAINETMLTEKAEKVEEVTGNVICSSDDSTQSTKYKVFVNGELTQPKCDP